MKKKLLLLGNNSVHTANYYHLVKDYFDDVLIVADKTGGSCEGLPVIALDYSTNPLIMLKTFQATKRIVKEFQPTIIHGQQINKALLFAVWANCRRKIPMVATAWGSDILVIPNQNFVYRLIVKYILRTIPYFSSDSQFMAEQMNRIAGRKLDITIANFGIDVVENSLEKQNIIYSNRLHEKLYRIDRIISAFGEFSKTNPGWNLVVAATGSETDKLKMLVNQLGITDKVKFVGWLDKTQNNYYYSIAKYWVSIPKSDATSISLFEAMSFDCIPVVSDLPANREWVKDGENGLVVSDINSNFIALATDIPTEKVVRINRDIVMKNATKEANKAKYLGIYKKILERQ